jgi:hypothetical protein
MMEAAQSLCFGRSVTGAVNSLRCTKIATVLIRSCGERVLYSYCCRPAAACRGFDAAFRKSLAALSYCRNDGQDDRPCIGPFTEPRRGRIFGVENRRRHIDVTNCATRRRRNGACFGRFPVGGACQSRPPCFGASNHHATAKDSNEMY